MSKKPPLSREINRAAHALAMASRPAIKQRLEAEIMAMRKAGKTPEELLDHVRKSGVKAVLGVATVFDLPVTKKEV